MYGGQQFVGGKFVSMWNTKVSLRYVQWPTCRWRQDCFYVEYEGFTEMYSGQHVVGGKFVSMWNMKVSLRYVRWPTSRWRKVCFYVEYKGFTEICTVANMSLAASSFLCGI